jgi:hypothetical protein
VGEKESVEKEESHGRISYCFTLAVLLTPDRGKSWDIWEITLLYWTRFFFLATPFKQKTIPLLINRSTQILSVNRQIHHGPPPSQGLDWKKEERSWL